MRGNRDLRGMPAVQNQYFRPEAQGIGVCACDSALHLLLGGQHLGWKEDAVKARNLLQGRHAGWMQACRAQAQALTCLC